MTWTVALVWYSLWWASLAYLAIRFGKLVLSDLAFAVFIAPPIPLFVLAYGVEKYGNYVLWKRP